MAALFVPSEETNSVAHAVPVSTEDSTTHAVPVNLVIAVKAGNESNAGAQGEMRVCRTCRNGYVPSGRPGNKKYYHCDECNEPMSWDDWGSTYTRAVCCF